MTSLFFVNPLLLWALPLAAVPIVIHLLNRRRYQRRRWAAMEYLLRAAKKNRRRLRMEQWLVLLLRTLAILLLALFVARPRLDDASLTGSLRHHVVVVDDSASMAERLGANDVFGATKDAALGLVGTLVARRGGDRLTVTRSSRIENPELAGITIQEGTATRVRSLLASWTVGDGTLDTGRILTEAAERGAADEEADAVRIHLFTDGRRNDWIARGGPASAEPRLAEAVAAALESLDPGRDHLRVHAVTSARAVENLAVRDLTCRARIATTGAPLDFEVEVANLGERRSRPTELRIGLDDGSRTVVTVPPIAPGESARIPWSRTLRDPGAHGVRARLAADRYEVDDGRVLALEVRETLRAALVDGDPGDEPFESETFFLAAAMDPADDARAGVSFDILSPRDLASDEFLAGQLETLDLLWLANVSATTLAPEVVEALRAWCMEGGGLVVSLGDQVDARAYDEILADRNEVQGLLPARLTGVAGDRDRPSNGFLVEDAAGSPFADVAESLGQLYANFVLFGRWFRTEPAVLEPPASALVRIGGKDGDPFLLQRPIGRGTTLLWTSAADSDDLWTNIVRTYAFLVTVQEAVRSCARPQDRSLADPGTSGTFVVRVDPAVHRPDVEVRYLPSDDEPAGPPARTFTPGTADAGADAAAVGIPLGELSGLGLFAARRSRHDGGVDETWFARNPPLAESLLARLPARALESAVPEELRPLVSVDEIRADAGSPATESARLEPGESVWRWLAGAMVLALLLESVLAARTNRA